MADGGQLLPSTGRLAPPPPRPRQFHDRPSQRQPGQEPGRASSVLTASPLNQGDGSGASLGRPLSQHAVFASSAPVIKNAAPDTEWATTL